MNVLLKCLKAAWPSTRKTCLWLYKLLIPITLTVTLLKHFGILAWIAEQLNPLFVYLGLPGESAVVFISGAAAGTYSGLVAMMTLPYTMREATILGLMILICHALPMECSVNRKTGSSFWKMAVIRIIAAFVCALYLNFVLPDMPGNFIYLGAPENSSLSEVLQTWAISQLKMTVSVAAIIYGLMFIQRLIEHYDLMNKVCRWLSPLMVVFGLPKSAAYMWLVGNMLGLSYGSAVMLDLEEKKLITQEEANDANYHLIMNHSLFEDTIIFAAAGISAFWVVSTRVLFAFVLVWSRKLLFRVKE